MVRNVVITAGGTSEKIDEVRMISNFSSGKLGLAIAKCFLESKTANIEKIYYMCDRNTIVPDDERVEVVRVLGAQGLLNAFENLLTTTKIDAVIHAMAVSDYTVKQITTIGAIKAGKEDEDKLAEETKISSEIDDLVIVLKRTPKVIGEIKKLQNETILVGFKLLSKVSKEELIQTGYKLLKRNNCDMVLANDLNEITEEKHIGYLISHNGDYIRLCTKKQIANEIVKNVEQLLA